MRREVPATGVTGLGRRRKEVCIFLVLLTVAVASAFSDFIRKPVSRTRDKLQIRAVALGFRKGACLLYSLSRHVSVVVEGIRRYPDTRISKWLRRRASDLYWPDLEDEVKVYCSDVLYAGAFPPTFSGPDSLPPWLILGGGRSRPAGSKNFIGLVGLSFRF